MPLTQIDLYSKIEPLEWLVDGLFVKGYINFVGALQGSGKTAILAALAWQMSRPDGGTFLGTDVSHGTTMYVDYDAPGANGRSFRYWLNKDCRAYPDGDLSCIIALEPDRMTFGLGEAELSELATRAQETGASLIILDSFMSCFPSVDPVKLNSVTSPMWFLRNLAEATGASLVVVDHLPKPLNGEAAGARGLIGSIGKPAQARAVHILSRVPPRECGGKNLLRWDVQKMSFAAMPEPFGVELHFDGEKLFVEEAELPEGQGETKTDRAVRAMQNHLEAKRGLVVDRKALLEVGIKGGNVRERAAANALKHLLERLGDAVMKVTLPGPGQPIAYRLKSEGDEKGEVNETEAEEQQPFTMSASKHQTGETLSATEQSLMHTSLHQNVELHQKNSVPPEILELRRRWQAGAYQGKRLELPGRTCPDLGATLGTYFVRESLRDGELTDLRDIAGAVGIGPRLFEEAT